MFHYDHGRLTCQGVGAEDLAGAFGTPLYVYDLDLLVARYRRLRDAFAPLEESKGGRGLMLAYSCKANGHLAIMQTLAAEGAWFDIVSGGELLRVRRAGIDPGRAIFAGVGKSRAEIVEAARAGIYCFNVESDAEAERIDDVGRELGRKLPVALRLNPQVDAITHTFITTGRKGDKFGIALDVAKDLTRRIDRELKNVTLRGFHAHIGSQIKRADRHALSLDQIMAFLGELRAEGLAAELETLNIGGGYGIAYEPGDEEIDIQAVAAEVVPRIKELGVKLILEPGRFIVGPSGALITRVEYVKHGYGKRFIIVDASMTELIRPSIYGAYHRIIPAREPDPGDKATPADVVGPVCESTDFLAKDRDLPQLVEGDVLAILDAGAYGIVMSSRYNTRPRPAEVAIKGGRPVLISERQQVERLLDHERTLDVLGG